MTPRTVEQIDADIARLQAERSEALQNAPLILPTSFMSFSGAEALHVAGRFDMQGDLKIVIENRNDRRATWIKRRAARTLIEHIERAIDRVDINTIS